MPCDYRNKEKVEKSKVKFCLFLFIQGIVFWPAKSKSDVYFCQPEPEIIDNPENKHFLGLSRVSELNSIQKIIFCGSITDQF